MTSRVRLNECWRQVFMIKETVSMTAKGARAKTTGIMAPILHVNASVNMSMQKQSQSVHAKYSASKSIAEK